MDELLVSLEVDGKSGQIYKPVIRKGSNNSPNPRTCQRKLPGITIPEPFKMTLRGETNVRKRQPQNEDNTEIECLKQFRASPVPAHVFLPLYETMTREQHYKRIESIQQRKSRIINQQRPFSFADDSRGHRRRSNSVPNLVNVENTPPSPAIPIRQRFNAASRIKNKLGPRIVNTNEEVELPNEYSAKSQHEKLGEVASSPPKMQQTLKDRCMANNTSKFSAKNLLKETILLPHHHPARDTMSRTRDSTASVSVTKLTRRSNCTSKTMSDFDEMDAVNLVTPKMTMAAMMREATNRKRIEKEMEHSERRSVESHKKQELMKELKRRIAYKTMILSPKPASESQAEIFRNFRQADKARLQDFRLEMKNMMERVKSRPLLMEKQLQMSAVGKVERRFKECLDQGGINEDMLLTFSQKPDLETLSTHSSSSKDQGSPIISDADLESDESANDYCTVEDSSEKTLVKSSTSSSE